MLFFIFYFLLEFIRTGFFFLLRLVFAFHTYTGHNVFFFPQSISTV